MSAGFPFGRIDAVEGVNAAEAAEGANVAVDFRGVYLGSVGPSLSFAGLFAPSRPRRSSLPLLSEGLFGELELFAGNIGAMPTMRGSTILSLLFDFVV